MEQNYRKTRWPYCVEYLQYSIRLESIVYLRDCLSGRVSKDIVVTFYGSMLWDMTHSAIEGLRRVWDLPAATHSKFVTSPCGFPQPKVELACRCVKFIMAALCNRGGHYIFAL